MNIEFTNISKAFNGSTIFQNITGRINSGDKIGLIGQNGVGKTTLLKILCKKEEKDSGNIFYAPESLLVSYFEQNFKYDSDRTLYEEVYNHMSNEESSANIQDISTKTRSLLFNIGILEKDFQKKISQLSGGEKTKLFLSKVLSQKTDLLILDEPTNHLDLNTVKWLENFIRKLSITVVIVSHDRQFLDNTVKRIFEMNSNELKTYEGNYSFFRIQREIEILTLKKQYEKETREINHLRKIIAQRTEWFAKTDHKPKKDINYGLWKDKSGNQARIIKSKQSKLLKLESNRTQKTVEKDVNIFDIVNRYFIDRHLPKYLIDVKNLAKYFDTTEILKNVSFQIKPGEKVAILGNNGSGKTTLLKILLSNEEATLGSVYIAPSIKLGYFSQELDQLNNNTTLLNEFILQGISQQNARSMLSALHFGDKDIGKKIEFLSMGEKCRVALGKLILSQVDILLLDEPTNFMDIMSRENFETVISQYKGTVILVTHDRYFINKFAEKILLVENKQIKVYNGGYKYFQSKRIHEKKEQSVGKKYYNILDDIMVLECRLAFVSRKLGNKKLEDEQKDPLTKEFFQLSAKLSELKNQIK